MGRRVLRRGVDGFEANQLIHGVGQLRYANATSLSDEPGHRLILWRRDTDKFAAVVHHTRQTTFRLQCLYAINCILINKYQSINQSNFFIVRPKVDQRAGQLSLPQLGITKTDKIELKHKTDKQISRVNSLEPWDQSDGSSSFYLGHY